MTPCYQFKLLNGPLAGRVLQLPAGTFTLGPDNCDLALSLEGAARATLEVSEQQVVLSSNTPCWVQGRRWSGGPLPCAQGIDLAGVHFVLTPPQTDIAKVSLPPRQNRQLAYWTGGLAAVLICTLALTALSWFDRAAPTASPTPRDWLAQALRSEPGLAAHWQAGPVVRLSGRCSSSEHLAALLERLHTAGIHVQQQALCDDDLQHAVHALLLGRGYADATVRVAPDGRVLIDGPVHADARFPALADALDHLTGPRGWQLSDQSAIDFAALMHQLTHQGLLAGLNASYGPSGWLLSGQLTPERQTALLQLLDKLNRAAAGQPERFHFVNVPSHTDPAQFLPAPLSSLGGNAQAPYLELRNGTRLQTGSPTLQGMHIVQMDAAGISLADDHRLVFLPLHI